MLLRGVGEGAPLSQEETFVVAAAAVVVVIVLVVVVMVTGVVPVHNRFCSVEKCEL